MRILGIDHGDARIGLALSDETGTIATPLQIVRHTARAADARTVARLAAEHGAERIVVGLPTDSEGQIGPQARKVQRWAEALAEATGIAIEFWDESFTSEEVAALRRARHARAKRRGEPLDAEAAALILQNYLDAHRTPQPPEETAE
ncbi:MAG: Holliday junction resolvase RuvX [Chloroflexi bacterium]|nr:Holliday junction resolvase RuvX [Chloroflexota bacterium]